MEQSSNLYKKFFIFIGFVFFLFLTGIFPLDLLIPIVLFAVISYGGVLLIKFATTYDSRIKKTR